MDNKLLVHKHLIVRAEAKNPPMDEAVLTEWFKKFIDEVGDAISEEEAKDLKKGFREGITKYSTELKNNIDNEFSNKTFQTTDGKVITYQDLMNAANGVNANSPE